MSLDTRTDAEKRYDATRLSREPIVETLLDAAMPSTTAPVAYNWDKCIDALQRLEDAVGIPRGSDEVTGRIFDKETADALDVFTSWWGKARKQRQPA